MLTVFKEKIEKEGISCNMKLLHGLPAETIINISIIIATIILSWEVVAEAEFKQ